MQTSKTFPSLCRATLETTIAHLEAVARVTTIDYNGVFQERGGDPVAAELMDDVGEKVISGRGGSSSKVGADKKGQTKTNIVIVVFQCLLLFYVTWHWQI